MGNPLTLYLVNQKEEKLDLLCGEFKLKLNEWNESFTKSFEKVAGYQFIHNKIINLLEEETFDLNGYCLTGADYRTVRDYTLAEDGEYRLYFRDRIEDKLYYCHVLVSSVTKQRLDKSDEYEVTLGLTKVSNWISIALFNPPTMSSETYLDNNLYDIVYGDFVYGQDIVTANNRGIEVNNQGHESAPFELIVYGGGVDCTWECIQGLESVASGKLNGNILDSFIINSTSKDLGARTLQGRDLGAKLDYTKVNYFNLPKGKSIFRVSNAEAWEVKVYEQYRQV